MNWGLTYDLPNETWIVQHRHEKFPKPIVQRRHKRELFSRLEVVLDKYERLVRTIDNQNARLN